MNTQKWDKCLSGGHKGLFKPAKSSGTSNHPHKCIIIKPLDYVPVSSFSDMLDIGCGDGWTCDYLHNKFGGKAVGLTINPEEKTWAEKLYPNIEITTGDAHDLPYADESFDFVYMRDSFEHMLAPYLVLEEVSRVLRKDGYLLNVVPGVDWQDAEDHLIVPTERQMKHLLNLADFKLVKLEVTNKDTWKEYREEYNKGGTCNHIEYIYLCQKN